METPKADPTKTTEPSRSEDKRPGAAATTPTAPGTGFQQPSPGRIQPLGSPQPSVGSEAKEVVSHAVDQAKQVATTQLATRSEKSAGELRAVAQGLRSMTEKLGENTASPYVKKAADKIENLSEFLRSAKPRDVQRSVEQFARREPTLFLGAAFAVGIAVVRFLKSSIAEPEAPAGAAAQH
jgi:hypothetical protein